MPANAGIQIRSQIKSKTAWIPASAGMTGTRFDFQSTNSEPSAWSHGSFSSIDPQTISL
jgi:hypothetical protein